MFAANKRMFAVSVFHLQQAEQKLPFFVSSFCRIPELWRHGDRDINMRHGNMEKWRHKDMDIETWTWRYGHEDMDMETWHGDMDM